jgi:hypothetical protein
MPETNGLARILATFAINLAADAQSAEVMPEAPTWLETCAHALADEDSWLPLAQLKRTCESVSSGIWSGQAMTRRRKLDDDTPSPKPLAPLSEVGRRKLDDETPSPKPLAPLSEVVVHLGVLLPLSGSWQRGRTIAGAAVLAVERINLDASLLPGSHIRHELLDAGCNVSQGITSLLTLLDNSELSAVIGPGRLFCTPPLSLRLALTVDFA